MSRPTSYGELAHVLRILPTLCFEKRRLRGLTLRAAAAEIGGISFNTLTRFEQGEDVHQSTITAVLAWVGAP